jgi:hypothetical protein
MGVSPGPVALQFPPKRVPVDLSPAFEISGAGEPSVPRKLLCSRELQDTSCMKGGPSIQDLMAETHRRGRAIQGSYPVDERPSYA